VLVWIRIGFKKRELVTSINKAKKNGYYHIAFIA